ncbi:MAG: hypothetical protein QOC56_841, partial [Alphaproteobacteria bacterium]|nr:hypothetical protein [Alphaproteobacteria bacterium]
AHHFVLRCARDTQATLGLLLSRTLGPRFRGDERMVNRFNMPT